MKIRLYLDEDSMNHALVAALRMRGVDVLTALDADLLGASDEDHLQFASQVERVLYTFNVSDFCVLHAHWLTASRNHFGIVVARQKQFSIGEQMRRLLRLIAAETAESMQRQIEFLSAWS